MAAPSREGAKTGILDMGKDVEKAPAKDPTKDPTTGTRTAREEG
jgi:hypothetical protein